MPVVSRVLAGGRAAPVALLGLMFCCVNHGAVGADPMIPYLDTPLLQSPTTSTAAEPALAAAKPDPLEKILQSVVTVTSTVDAQARTAATHGLQRKATGVVIDGHGLIVTVDSVLAEAESVKVTLYDDRSFDADVVAYDAATALGLIRTREAVSTTPLVLGDSSTLKVDNNVMILPADGRAQAKAVKIGKLKRYTSGWEFSLSDAIHTFPPSTQFSGAALLNDRGELVGIGALVSIDIDIDPKVRVPGNIFVPVNSLTSVMGELLTAGRSTSSQRPWLGLETKDSKAGVVVSGIVADSPAAASDVKIGDRVVALGGQSVSRQHELYRRLWSNHKPGEGIQLLLLREKKYLDVKIDSVDRYDWLQPADKEQTVLSELVE